MTTSKNATKPVESDYRPPAKRKHCLYTGCRKLFTPKRPWQTFCNPKCKDSHHNFGSAYGSLTKRGTDRLVKESKAKLEKELPKLAKRLLRDQDKRIEGMEKKQAAMQSDLDRITAAFKRYFPDQPETNPALPRV